MNAAVFAALAVAAGTAAGWSRAALALPLSLCCAIGVIAALVLSRRGRVAIAAALVALAAGAGASASWRSSAIEGSLLPRLAREHAVVRACGTTQLLRHRSVEIRAGTVERISQSREPGSRLWSTSEQLRVAGDEIKQLRVGERVCATGAVLEPREGRDEAPLLLAQRLERGDVGSLIRLVAGSVRARFSEVAQDALPRTQAGLLLGMTEGDVALLDEETIEDFRTTGLAHLVAVSGSNVAVVLVVVMLLARALIPRSRWLRAIVAVPPLIFFAFLTGLEPSVLRATVTAGVALAITAGGRMPDAIRLASLAFVLVVLATPELMFHPGFQLSFAATLGLILWARPLSERLERALPEGRLWTLLAIAVGTTVAAQLAASPLLAWHFGRIPAVGGIANLIVAPLAPVVMIGGMATLGLASLSSVFDWLPATMRLVLDVVLLTARWFASVPAASLGMSVLAAVAVTSAVALLAARSARARGAAAACAILFGAASAGQIAGGPACAGPSIVALDVEQGTAILLRSGSSSVLVDGGPEEGGVTYDLEELGVRELDAVFISHPHADHTEGVVRALERLDVGRVIGPVILPWRKGGEVIAAARRAGVPVSEGAAGDEFSFEDMRIEVMFPPPGPAPQYAEEEVHGFNLVLRADLGGVRVLLPGDVGIEEEEQMAGEDVSAEVFVAPHHGSKDLDPEFVDAVDPKLTLVSVGADNRYGHPAPEALAAYARHGNVFRTDKDGSVMVCLTGTSAEVTTTR